MDACDCGHAKAGHVEGRYECSIETCWCLGYYVSEPETEPVVRSDGG